MLLPSICVVKTVWLTLSYTLSIGNVSCNSLMVLCTAPSMSHYLNQTSKVVLDKYEGDLDNLRKEANHDPAKERELVKEFKVCMTSHASPTLAA